MVSATLESKTKLMEKHELKKIKNLSSLLAEIIPDDIPLDLDETKRRRLEIVIRANMGQSQAQICNALGCSRDTARYWIAIAKGNKASSWQEHSVGRPKTINDLYLKRLRELVSSSPKEQGYSFQRWTAKCLSKHLARELGITVSDRHVSRLLKQMGLSTKGIEKSGSLDKSTQPKSGIAIDDLNPASRSQLQDSQWWF